MTQQSDQDSTPLENSNSGNKATVIAIIVIVLAVLAAVIWWFSSSNETTSSAPSELAQANSTSPAAVEQPQPVVNNERESSSSVAQDDSTSEPATDAQEPTEPKQTAASEPSEPEPELPALNESTPTVLQTLDASGVAIQPLKSSQLVRDAVVIIDNLRNGMLVSDRTIVQRPDGRFSVIEIDGDLYIDEQSYQRYDALVDWFVSLDEQALLQNYQLFKPLLQEAYAEIGYPNNNVTTALVEAINQLLATPIPETLVAVKDDEVMYTFANDEYEALPPAQKQLLRMGPDNITRLKAKLVAIKQEFQANL